MTLHTVPNVEPRSEQWHALRRGIVTASGVGHLITSKTLKIASNDGSRRYVTTLAAERITGYSEPTYTSADMWRGIEDEPRAIAHYTERYAPVTSCGFMVRDDWGVRLGYSPDGLVGDDGLIEIKSCNNRIQLATILSGEVPAEHMAQLQCGLLVSGRQWIDYVSYSGGMPMWVHRVTPNMPWHDAIMQAVYAAEDAITAMVADYTAAVAGLPLTERIIEQEMSL